MEQPHHGVRRAYGGAAALPGEAVHQHSPTVQKRLRDELQAALEVPGGKVGAFHGAALFSLFCSQNTYR
jgi:hypothetical protein